MRVCFVIGTLGRGGAERQLLYMLKALLVEQIHVRAVCLTKGEAYEREISDQGIDVDYIGHSPGRLSRLTKLTSNLRKRPADLIQSTHFYTNIYAAAAGRVMNVPSIGAIRNDLTSEVASNGIWGRWQLSLPRSQIANTNLAVERAIAAGYESKRIFLVRNAVATNEVETRSKTDSKTRLLFAGRLVDQKRPELFIDLAHRLCRELNDRDLEFVIAGDGPLRSVLEERVARDRLGKEKIKFIGEQPFMPDVYKCADILVLTSAHEGTPNVILEAMAHGLPVIATRVGGVPEVVPDGCGFLIEPGDLEGLVSSATTLILDDDTRERMGRQARSHVRVNHSINRLQERLMEVYSSVLNHKEVHS